MFTSLVFGTLVKRWPFAFSSREYLSINKSTDVLSPTSRDPSDPALKNAFDDTGATDFHLCNCYCPSGRMTTGQVY